MNLFSNFPIPKQSENEQLLYVIHRHWFNILQQFFIIFFLLFLILGSFFFSPALFPVLQTREMYKLFLFIEDSLILVLWLYAFIVWIDYYLDVWIITTERVINIEQRGLFLRRMSELNFGKIQDVTAEVEGFIPTILNYGDVHIQTAGEEERFVFRQIPDPYKIKTAVMKMSREAQHKSL